MTDRPGDPADKATDAKADGAFGGVQTHSHRAGYGDDRLARLVDYLRRNPRATLASGEGAVLLAEIDRLTRILAALREPSEGMRNKVCGAYFSSWDSRDIWTVVIHAAVAAAEQEVGP